MPRLVATGSITLSDLFDGISIVLSNNAHLVPASSDGSNPDLTGASSTVSVRLGSTVVTSQWTITATPSSGVTGTFSSPTYTVTGMTVDAGYVDFTASKPGETSLTGRFSLAKVKQGVATDGNQDFSEGLVGWSTNTTRTIAAITQSPAKLTIQPTFQGRPHVIQLVPGQRFDLYSNKLWPVQQARTYRVRASLWIGAVAPTSTYIGMRALDAAGVEVTGNGGHIYNVAGGGAYATNQWHDLVSAPFLASSIHANLRNIQLLTFMNYNNTASAEAAIDGIWLEDITEQTAAAASASAAATSFSNASTQAGLASGSATAAAGSATTASGHSSTASGHAGTASTQASNASGSAAAAAASAVLAASVSTQSYFKNPIFTAYPTTPGLPTDWTDWSNATSSTRVAGEVGGYAVTINGGAGLQAGLVQYGNANQIYKDQYFVIEADVLLNSGSLAGAGVLVYAANASNSPLTSEILTFSTAPDTTGVAPGAGVVGKIYRFRRLVKATDVNTNRLIIYAMSHWTSHGSIAAANSLTWYRCSARVATEAEVTAGVVIPPLQVTISDTQTAVASLEQVYGSYGIEVNANGNIAGMFLYAESGIVNSSGVRFEADEFSIKSTTAPTITPFVYDAVAGRLTLANVSVSEIEATATIKIGAGDNAVILDGKSTSDKRIAVGNAIADSAPFWVSKTGKMKATDWELYDASGALMLSKNGPTEAFKLAILASAANSLPTAPTIVKSVPGVANTTSVPTLNKVAARLGDDSTVTIGVSWDLASAYGANYAAFAASPTLTVMQRYSADGVSWGSWASVGSQTFTKISSGSPTSTQIRVVEETTTYQEYDAEFNTYYNYSETFAYVDAGNPAVFNIAVNSKAAGYYEFCVVDATVFAGGSPYNSSSVTLTLTDTDGTPSFILNNLAASGSVSYVNPIGAFNKLKILQTGAYTCSVSARWVIVSTPEGLTRTIGNLATTFDLSLTAGSLGRLVTGSVAANTWYYVWAVSNGSLDGVVVSTSLTDPAMPGYRYKALIGAARTNASGQMRPFVQYDNKVRYTAASNSDLLIASGSSGSTTTPTWTASSIDNFFPSSITADVTLQVSSQAGTTMVAPNNSFGAYNSTTNAPPFSNGAANFSGEFTFFLEGTSVYYACSHTTGRLVARGFVLTI